MWTSLRKPLWVARIVFLIGAITVLSALLPAFKDRSSLVNELVPEVFPAAAATGAAAVGLMLIAISRALRRGKYRAWLFATVLDALAVGLHLLKGLDIEEALLALALLVLLLSARRNFTARPDPRSLGRVVSVLVLGPVVATLLGWAWLAIDSDGQVRGTTQLERITHAFLGLMGIDGPVGFVNQHDDNVAAVALVVLGAAVLLLALVVALQPADGPHPLTEGERERLGGILGRWGGIDSLSYFSLRDDRSVVFSPTGKSAITYRVVGTVSLAAGDPVGDPEAWPGAIQAWLDEARSFGWVPAVLAASERGAEAFHRVGLDALEFGDEAILHTSDFTLDGRSMRVVRQAIARCERAGLQVTCHRVSDLDAATLDLIRSKSEQWREGTVERGFSMALGRCGQPEDGRAVVALSTDADGELRGLLHFVPWGDDGLSLDLMRRDATAGNGLVEQLVAAVMRDAEVLGVEARVPQLRRLPQRLRPGRATRRRTGAAPVALGAAQPVALLADRVALPRQREVPTGLGAPLHLLPLLLGPAPRRRGGPARRGVPGRAGMGTPALPFLAVRPRSPRTPEPR